MTARRRPPWTGLLEALLLLAFAAAALAFAAGPRYTTLMSPSFGWVTQAGAVLLAGQGLALLLRPRRTPGPGSLLAFGTLALLVVLGRPDRSIGASIVPPDVGPAPTREGYEELRIESLFRTLSEEADGVPEGRYVVPGRVHRVPRPDTTVEHLLLYPKVACCLADAIAYAVRLELPPGVSSPEGATWVYVYGALERAPTPIETPPFRVDAIAYTAVSRTWRLRAQEIVDHRALLGDVTARIPEAQCGAFLRALDATNLLERLQGEETLTVFAPIDSAFLRQVRTLDPEGTEKVEADRLRRYLEDFLVAGNLLRADLFRRESVETLSGRLLAVRVENGRPVLEGARILFADQIGRNGIVHVVHPAWAPASD